MKRGRKYDRVNVVAGQYVDKFGKVRRVAALCYRGTTTAEFFERWFATTLAKSVPRGATIILDRAAFHRRRALEILAAKHGLTILFLPAYSPDLNPIEKTWANMKKALIETRFKAQIRSKTLLRIVLTPLNIFI